MGSWRRKDSDFYHRDVQQEQRSSGRRPPPPSGPGDFHSNVPSWEKKFCSSVGGVSWRKLIETKKYISLHDDVIQWDNSAGEEAFNNAKKRFWAGLNHLPCDIPLPDPELYIEDVDWDTKVDPELISELEHEKEVREENASMPDYSRLLDLPVPCTGWGDEEDCKPKAAVPYSDSKWEALDQGVDKNGNPWECNGDWGDVNLQGNDGWGGDWNSGHVKGNDGWGGDWNSGHIQVIDGWGGDWNGGHMQGGGSGRGFSDKHVRGNGWRRDDGNNSRGWNQPETNRSGRKVNYGISNDFDGNGGNRASWDIKNKEESPSCSMSRFKTTRFYGDNHHVNRGGWSGRGQKRGNYSHERSFQDKNAGSRRWNCA